MDQFSLKFNVLEELKGGREDPDAAKSFIH